MADRPGGRTVAVLVVCLAVLVGVPGVWWLTRGADSLGVTATGLAEASRSASSTSTSAPNTSPSLPAGTTGSSTLPRATARPAVQSGGEVPAPVRLSIPSLPVTAPLDPQGVDRNGAMALPEDVRRVGWYRYGPGPGAVAGSVVLAGHVDSKEQGPGALFRLGSVQLGDRVVVTTADGLDVAYRVVGRERLVKKRLPVEELFRRDGPHRLVLITCGGEFIRELSSYRDNIVVIAEPVA